jgi:hypothetical protein
VLKSGWKISIAFSENPRQKPRFTGHRGAILRIGQEYALLGREPLGKYGNMRERADDGGNPCGVDQRQRASRKDAA